MTDFVGSVQDKNKDKLACQKPPEQSVNFNKHITSVLEQMSQAAEHDLGRHVNENSWRIYSYKKVHAFQQ